MSTIKHKKLRDPCFACYVEDTPTFLQVVGGPEFLAYTARRLGLPLQEATVLAHAWRRHSSLTIRVCVDCAAKANLQVGPPPGPIYMERLDQMEQA